MSSSTASRSPSIPSWRMLKRINNRKVLKMIIATYTEPSGRPVAEIRYEMTGNHMYVNTSVNGHGPYRFIFDSGAGATVIDADLARKLGLKSGGIVAGGGAG